MGWQKRYIGAVRFLSYKFSGQTPIQQKRAFLDFLNNNFFGGSGLQVQIHTNEIVTKWKDWLEVRDSDWWVERINQRRVCSKVELVLDIDPKEGQDKFKMLYDTLATLRKYDVYPLVFTTGGKGFHLHYFDNEMLDIDRKELKMVLSSIDGLDALKVGEKTLINLEYAPHRKTGKVKEVISWV